MLFFLPYYAMLQCFTISPIMPQQHCLWQRHAYRPIQSLVKCPWPGRGFQTGRQLWYGARLWFRQPRLWSRLFPLGELSKEQVRSIARDNNLINANKKDSVGICFIGKNNYNDFISNFLGKNPGEIVDENGTKLGSHIKQSIECLEKQSIHWCPWDDKQRKSFS